MYRKILTHFTELQKDPYWPVHKIMFQILGIAVLFSLFLVFGIGSSNIDKFYRHIGDLIGVPKCITTDKVRVIITGECDEK